MLENAAQIEFGVPGYVLPESIASGQQLIIPITVTSFTAHNIPSGTSFNREAWLETIITHDADTLFSSGYIANTAQELDKNDPSLLLFTSYLLDETGDTTTSITMTHDMLNETLPALGFRYHLYEYERPTDLTGTININVRMRFRAFAPQRLVDVHADLLANQPVFDMDQIDSQILINGN
jgi:hypothetical protein